jgi:hypothetical protein
MKPDKVTHPNDPITVSQKYKIYRCTLIKTYDLNITKGEADILIKRYNAGEDIRKDVQQLLNNNEPVTA